MSSLSLKEETQKVSFLSPSSYVLESFDWNCVNRLGLKAGEPDETAVRNNRMMLNATGVKGLKIHCGRDRRRSIKSEFLWIKNRTNLEL